MARIPEELIDRIKREVPVADLCREYGIELKPKGKDHFASCPWHEDSDPSFTVTPGKNLWNCLGGCSGGDNIQLVMRCEKISFRRAAEKLAARLGIAPEAAKITTWQGTAHEILHTPDDCLSDAQLMGISADPLDYNAGINNKIKTLKRKACGFRDETFFILKLFSLHESMAVLTGVSETV